MQLNKKDLEKADRKWRLNLINSLSGIKPANLIGTRSEEGVDNVAIFSSVVHLGSNPAQLGFIMRPLSEPPRDTLPNILNTGFYTINHVPTLMIEQAHYTSAKLSHEESEFDRMKIEREFIDGFHAPFVKDSPVKIGMKYQEQIPLPNGCSFIIGTVDLLIVPDEHVNDLGRLDLEACSTAGISGLNTYYNLKKLESFPYVRIDAIPEF